MLYHKNLRKWIGIMSFLNCKILQFGMVVGKKKTNPFQGPLKGQSDYDYKYLEN